MPIRQFKVTVNGRDYEVAVQEINTGAATAALAPAGVPPAVPSIEHPSQPSLAAKPAAAAPAPAPAPARSGADEVAPMGGVIVQIDVTLGQTVAVGQRLLVLEAMKMKTHIQASHPGKVTRLLVAAGDSVESGQPLVSIE